MSKKNNEGRTVKMKEYDFHSRYNVARKWLIFWCLFIGIGAVFGSSCMLIKPDGSILHMQEMLPYFQVLPFSKYLFQNYIFPGIALLIVNGISNLIATYFLFKKKPIGDFLGMLFGITLMMWICIQFVIFPPNVLSISYFIFGLVQTGTGFACTTFRKQEAFVFDEKEYTNINSDSKTLVLYFSRMGYVRKKAYEIANEEHAAICEVKAKERTLGTLGFWWCGRFGMHCWPMKIESLLVNPAEYDKIIICSPIWVFHIAAPIRQLCMNLSIVLQDTKVAENVHYVIVHFEKSVFRSAIAEMDGLLKINHKSARSICCKRGKYLFNKEL